MAHEVVVALLRHADYHQPTGVPSALLPYGLTAEGKEQASAAGSELLQFSRANELPFVSRIDCSRMRRAFETASIIKGSIDPDGAMAIDEFDALAERSVGAAANLTVEQISDILEADPRYGSPPPNWKSDSHYCLPLQGAESLLTAGLRVAGHIEQAFIKAEALKIPGIKVIVGHGASIRHAAIHLGLLGMDEVAGLSMYHARPIYIVRTPQGFKHIAGDWKIRTGSQGGDEVRE